LYKFSLARSSIKWLTYDVGCIMYNVATVFYAIADAIVEGKSII